MVKPIPPELLPTLLPIWTTISTLLKEGSNILSSTNSVILKHHPTSLAAAGSTSACLRFNNLVKAVKVHDLLKVKSSLELARSKTFLARGGYDNLLNANTLKNDEVKGLNVGFDRVVGILKIAKVEVERIEGFLKGNESGDSSVKVVKVTKPKFTRSKTGGDIDENDNGDGTTSLPLTKTSKTLVPLVPTTARKSVYLTASLPGIITRRLHTPQTITKPLTSSDNNEYFVDPSSTLKFERSKPLRAISQAFVEKKNKTNLIELGDYLTLRSNTRKGVGGFNRRSMSSKDIIDMIYDAGPKTAEADEGEDRKGIGRGIGKQGGISSSAVGFGVNKFEFGGAVNVSNNEVNERGGIKSALRKPDNKTKAKQNHNQPAASAGLVADDLERGRSTARIERGDGNKKTVAFNHDNGFSPPGSKERDRDRDRGGGRRSFSPPGSRDRDKDRSKRSASPAMRRGGSGNGFSPPGSRGASRGSSGGDYGGMREEGKATTDKVNMNKFKLSFFSSSSTRGKDDDEDDEDDDFDDCDSYDSYEHDYRRSAEEEKTIVEDGIEYWRDQVKAHTQSASASDIQIDKANTHTTKEWTELSLALSLYANPTFADDSEALDILDSYTTHRSSNNEENNEGNEEFNVFITKGILMYASDDGKVKGVGFKMLKNAYEKVKVYEDNYEKEDEKRRYSKEIVKEVYRNYGAAAYEARDYEAALACSDYLVRNNQNGCEDDEESMCMKTQIVLRGSGGDFEKEDCYTSFLNRVKS